MLKREISFTLFILLILIKPLNLICQNLNSLELNNQKSLNITSFNQAYYPTNPLPLVSFQIDSAKYTSEQSTGKEGRFIIPGIIEIGYLPQNYTPGIKALITFRNISGDTILLHNVVPFGESSDHVYITGIGDHPLSRTHLFRPGYVPVNVIVPDNAWELGFSAFELSNGTKVSVP